MSALDRGFTTDGVKLMILLRVSPIIPANLLNYFMGATSITYCRYILGTLITLATNVFAIYLASSLKDISDLIRGDYSGTPEYLAYIITGIVLSLILVLLLVFITKR